MFQISTMANFETEFYELLTCPGDKQDEEVRNRSFARRRLFSTQTRIHFVLLSHLRDCLCKSGPVDSASDTDLAHFLCVVRNSCTYTKTTIRLIGSLYFSEFYGN